MDDLELCLYDLESFCYKNLAIRKIFAFCDSDTATDLSALINNKALGPLGMPLVKKGPGRSVNDVLLVQGFFIRSLSYPCQSLHIIIFSILALFNPILETWLIFINFHFLGPLFH